MIEYNQNLSKLTKKLVSAPRLRTVFKQTVTCKKASYVRSRKTPYYVLSNELCEGNIAESKTDSKEMA